MSATSPLSERPMRIVLLQTQAEAAGAQEISRVLAARLSARGHLVRQIFLFRRTEAFDADPNAVICAPRRPGGPVALARLLYRLAAELRRFRPAVVVTFQHYGNLIGAPVARLVGVPRVIANHNGLMELLSPAMIATDRAFGTLGLYSRIVVNSRTTEAEYARHPAPYRRRLALIEHGFDEKTSRLDRAAARASFGLPMGDTVLASVSRLHPAKRLDLAIRLLSDRPPWRLALAGQGEAQGDLDALARSLGVRDRVVFLGELSPARVGDLLAAIDVFVFPTRSETFGLAAVEAASAGVPVVASDLPVLRDVLSLGGEPCATFVDVADPAAFAAAADAAANRTEAVGRAAARGRQLRERFPLDTMVDGYEELITGRAPADGRARPAGRRAP